jgi:tetratricopeptide (TPR) repeat protein
VDAQRRKRCRLAVLAAVILAGNEAVADERSKALARQLFELGIEEYKAKDFEAAALSMAKVYALDPKPDALYALAQAERMSNKCESATKHYQMLIEQSKDDKTKQAVQANLELCAQILRGEKPKEVPAVEAHRDAPTIQIRTVYRTEQRSNKLAIGLFTAGGISLGGAATTYLLSRSTRSDADNAQTLEGFNDLYDRSQLLKHISWVAAGAGVALVSWATIRVIRGGKANSKAERNASVVPTRGGTFFAFSTTF